MKNLITALLCFFCASNGFSEKRTDIQVELYPQTAHIGDLIHLVFKVFRPEDSKFSVPDALTDLQNIEIKNVELKDEKAEKGTIQTILDYTIVSFKPGSYVLGPVSFNLQTSSGENIVLNSEKISLTIESLIKNTSKENDIRGPKPQLSIKVSPLSILIILILAILTIAVVWIVLRKTLLKPRETVRQIIELSADEQALQQLEELMRSPEMQRKNMKVIYTRLSDILRNYLGKRYSFDAKEMTSLECLREIKTRRLAHDLYEKIKFSLDKADLVKFAKFMPEAVEMPADIDSAKHIITQTREIFHAP